MHSANNSRNIYFLSGFVLTVILFFLNAIKISAQVSDTEIKLRAIADGIINNTSFKFIDSNSGKIYPSTAGAPSNAVLRTESPYNDWRYWNGVLNIAMIKLGKVLNENKYSEYSSRNILFAFDNQKYFEDNYKNQNKWEYTFGQFFIMEELDDCGAMGASVIEVYDKNRKEVYRLYIDKTANHILNIQSRLGDKTLVRTFPNKYTLWADDLYMGISFLSRMGELTRDERYFDDAVLQVINFNKYLFDDQKKLFHHFWYSDLNVCGAALWGRANGWALLAQVDLLDRLPKDHPKRNILLELLQRHILGVAQYQSGEGLWHQLLDKVDSYLETSCSAMFTYAIARAVNNGYIAKRFASIARRGWEGLMTKINTDGQVEGVCAGTSTSDDLVHYYKRPTPLNDIHGIGAIILAGTEILKLSN
jgi:rhamnogalacturonyl hydrolase YesR